MDTVDTHRLVFQILLRFKMHSADTLLKG